MIHLLTPLFLVGFMGAGKTTIARQLSISSGIPYVDTDASIERSAQMTVQEIFSQYGERAFREFEINCLRTIIQSRQALIVSTGGGMPCYEGNVELMRKAGFVVYLRLSAEALANRLRTEKSSRPLLASCGPLTLEEKINELLVARRGYYERAHLVIDAAELSQDEIAARILSHIASLEGA